ncbi:MAG: hypothetical protein UZ13_01001 [Chloroflexi bacterium OLB13]|nr:MAG: hypothetical protein UZ13_01001 [Chloroflexi bacterium OLB13]
MFYIYLSDYAESTCAILCAQTCARPWPVAQLACASLNRIRDGRHGLRNCGVVTQLESETAAPERIPVTRGYIKVVTSP